MLSIICVLTVLAPAAANAFGDADAHSPDVIFASPHTHAKAPHVHDDAGVHVHDDGDKAPTSGHHSGKTGLKCCGLACISALPALDVDVVRPDRALSVVLVFVQQERSGRAPAQHYRPPIS